MKPSLKVTVLASSMSAACLPVVSIVHAEDTIPVKTLPAIGVTAKSDASGYSQNQSSSATKLNLSQQETPQSVTIISSEQLEDQQISTLADALEQVPGLYQIRNGSAGAMGVGGEYSNFYARGSQIKNFSIDGIASSGTVDAQTGLNMARLDPAVYERITVVKGAAGLSTGAGYPSATVDLSRKLATSHSPKGSYTLSSINFDDKWSGYRQTFDYQSPLNQDGSLRARTVIAYTDQDSFMNWGETQNGLFYSTLAADLSSKTSANIGMMYQKGGINGLSVHSTTLFSRGLQFDRAWEYNSAPRWTYNDTDTTNAFIQLNHAFENGWDVHLNYNYLKQNTGGLWGTVASSPANADFSRQLGAVSAGSKQLNSEIHGVDLYGTGSYALFGRQHDLMMGASYQSFTSDNLYSFTNGTKWVNLNSWNGYIDVPVDIWLRNRIYTTTTTHQTGVFAATRFNLWDNVHTIFGARLSSYENASIRNDRPYRDFSDQNILTPYAGLLIDLNQNLTLYGNYTNIFLPQNTKDVHDSLLDPIEGNSLEAGLKLSLNEDTLNLSAAYFQSNLDNVAELVGELPTGESYYRAAQGTKTSGYELELTGQILSNWNIQGGYTYATTKEKGQRINLNQPKEMFKLNTVYQLPGALDAFTVGAGVRWQSELINANQRGIAYDIYKQKAFAVVDLMARYQLNRELSLGLNVRNVANEQYRTTATQATYGDPRTYILSMNYKF